MPPVSKVHPGAQKRVALAQAPVIVSTSAEAIYAVLLRPVLDDFPGEPAQKLVVAFPKFWDSKRMDYPKTSHHSADAEETRGTLDHHDIFLKSQRSPSWAL